MRNWLYKLKRYIHTVNVDVYPTRPDSLALMQVTTVWFNRKKDVRGQYIFLDNGRVDVMKVIDMAPYLDQYTCHYPENWSEQVAAYDEQNAKRGGLRLL